MPDKIPQQYYLKFQLEDIRQRLVSLSNAYSVLFSNRQNPTMVTL